MSDGKIVVTLKQGTGYNAPWIVISGDTVAEVQALVEQASPLYAVVRTAAAAFAGAPVDAPGALIQGELGGVPAAASNAVDSVIPAPGPNEGAGHYQNRVDAAVAAAEQAKHAGHPDAFCQQHQAPREFIEGVSKAGKPYKMWKCTKERSCAPKWVRP